MVRQELKPYKVNHNAVLAYYVYILNNLNFLVHFFRVKPQRLCRSRYFRAFPGRGELLSKLARNIRLLQFNNYIKNCA